jgi:hydroxylaminobenzene mutase
MDMVIERQLFSFKLMRSGSLLLLLGLLTGLVVPKLANPRMGLASHVEGVMGGMMLVVLSYLFPRLRLVSPALKAAYGLSVYGAFANWINPLIAAAWDAGGSMMPGASRGKKGTPVQETVITIMAVTMVLALLPAIALVLWGLRKGSRL